MNDFQCLFRCHGRVYLLADHHGRCESAGAETGYRLYGEHHIVRGMFLLVESQFFEKCFQDRSGFADMTGGAVAYLNDIFSLGFKGEVFIKGCYTVSLCFGDADLLRDIG